MEETNKLLAYLNKRGYIRKVQRYTYNYDLNYVLQEITTIGKARNPNFVIDNDNRFTYENLVRWLVGDQAMQCIDPITKQRVPGRLDAGIYISGGTGTGKSWALEIASAVADIHRLKIKVGYNEQEDKDDDYALRWTNVRADTICDEYTGTGTCQRFKNMPLLGIQDLGVEPRESLYMGNRVEVLRQILEERGDHQDRLTLITSNIPLRDQQITNKYGFRVASRLVEMCNYFEIKGADRRMWGRRKNEEEEPGVYDIFNMIPKSK